MRAERQTFAPDIESLLGGQFDPDIETILSGGISPLERRFRATRFPTKSATTKADLYVSLRELERLIRASWADDKGGLPWWKMARFGDVRSPLRPRPDGGGGMTGNSFRHDANVRGVTGCEADYDKEEISFAEAERRLREAGITALLYATPSSTATTPRWRVIAPFSEELPPAERKRFLARLNGIFDGALDGASFTLSQSFYGGNVRGRPKIATALIAGRYLDHADDLDAGAMGKRASPASEKATTGSFDEASALGAIMTGADYHGSMIYLGGVWARQGVGYADAVTRLEEAFDAVAEDQRDARWRERRATIAETLLYSYGRDAAKPKEDEEAEPRVDPNDVFTDADVFDEDQLDDEMREILDGPKAGLFAPASSWAAKVAPDREWLVPDMIPAGTVTMLGGDGGTGKSLLALGLAVSTASGNPWIGRTVARPGTVMFLSAEDDRDELHRRLGDICRSQHVDMAELDNLLVRSLAGEDALLATLDRKGNVLKRTRLYDRLDRAMAKARPSLLVLDTLADLHSGEENQRAHARQFVGLLRHLAIRHDCAVVLLAHPSLTGIANGSGLSGSTAWNASVRSRLYLDRVRDDEGNEIDSKARVLRTVKANYAETGTEIRLQWEHGAFVGESETFDNGDETPAERAERVFLRLLDECSNRKQSVSPYLSNTYAPAVFAKEAKREGVGKGAFVAAMQRLLDNGLLQIAEHGPPSKRRHSLRRASDG